MPADRERDPVDALGGDGGRHGVEDEQRQPGQRGAAERDGQGVDGERDQADPAHGDELDAGETPIGAL